MFSVTEIETGNTVSWDFTKTETPIIYITRKYNLVKAITMMFWVQRIKGGGKYAKNDQEDLLIISDDGTCIQLYACVRNSC